MTAAASFVRACPRCKGAVLWCDGQPSPELTIADGRIVGCGRCMGERPAPRPRAAPPPPAPSPPKDTRPVRQILAEEGGRVVSILGEGLDFLEKGAALWDKLRGKR